MAISKTKTCRGCDGPVSNGSKTGLCRACSNRDPGVLARRADGVRKAYTNPTLRAEQRARITELNRRPESRERSREIAKRPGQIERLRAGLTPEVRKRHGKTYSERALADIPPEMRETYLYLRKRKRMTAAEAREVVLRSHEAEMERFRSRLMEASHG